MDSVRDDSMDVAFAEILHFWFSVVRSLRNKLTKF